MKPPRRPYEGEQHYWPPLDAWMEWVEQEMKLHRVLIYCGLGIQVVTCLLVLLGLVLR